MTDDSVAIAIVKRPYFKMHATPAENSSFTVKELATIYGFPTPASQGNPKKVVGVISFGGGLYGVPANYAAPYVIPAYTASSQVDVQKYWASLGYSAGQMPQVIVYPIGGATNDLTDPDSSGENTLDVTIIGGACPNPNLTIVLFLFPSSYSFVRALPIVIAGITEKGVKYIPSIISISWGAPELNYLTNGHDTTGELANVASILKSATENGVNVCAAAGDNGSTDGNTDANGNPTNRLSLDFPAACPYVTAVGGSSLICPNKVYDAASKETVWNNGVVQGSFWGTGGGISTFYQKPAYQSRITISSTMRTVPDIALNSDPNTGVSIYINGETQIMGGTSMSAPLFAAFLALVNSTSFVNPLLYAAASSNFHDIVLGTNDDSSSIANAYSAQVGYDCCSGLGSINGANLKNIFASSAVPAPAPAPAKPILIKKIVLNKSTVSLNMTNLKTFQMGTTITPVNSTNKSITWLTSNSNIATISSTGLVTARALGSCLVGAFANDGSGSSAIGVITISKTAKMMFY